MAHRILRHALRMNRERTSARIPPLLDDVVAAALSRRERDDPVVPVTGGPAGNAVLTAWIGIVLLVLLVAQLLTLFDVWGFLTWHIAIGLLLIPPALAKTASTGWRMIRYYAGHRGYRRAGPPPLLLRLLGPLVVVSTVAVLASGVVLILIDPVNTRASLISVAGFRADWVTVHQASFAVWSAATGVHVLARIGPAVRLVSARSRAWRPVPGAPLRTAALAMVALIAAGTAVITMRVDNSGVQPEPVHFAQRPPHP